MLTYIHLTQILYLELIDENKIAEIESYSSKEFKFLKNMIILEYAQLTYL